MTSDLDILRTAQVLIREHGAEAQIHAAMSHNELLEAGDMEGRSVCNRVLNAVDVLLNETPEGRVH